MLFYLQVANTCGAISMFCLPIVALFNVLTTGKLNATREDYMGRTR